jgi:type II secretory pathway component PulF
MMATTSPSYSSGSVSEVRGALNHSTTTRSWLVEVLKAIGRALSAPQLRTPNKGSTGELGGALIYPLIMLGVGTPIMAFLLAYVVPQIATIFEQQHAVLPASTKFVIRVSAFVTSHWVAIAIPLVAVVVGIAGALATPPGRRLYRYYDHKFAQSHWLVAVLEPVMTIAMAAVIVFMMLAVLRPIFQLNQLMQ